MSYGSWAICGNANEAGEVRDRVLAIPGVFARPGETPVFNGTLEEWADRWKSPFTVNPVGAYIIV